jgi:phage host-nuclease inhibitor protein Gam
MRDAIQYEVEAQTKDVYAALAQRKSEIEAEFSGKAEAVDENIKKLTEDIKTEVKNLHYTVSGKSLQAVYVKGKKSWIPQRLDAYVETHPDIKECYTVGDPSVTIRKVV